MIAQLDLFQGTAARDRAVAKVAKSTPPEWRTALRHVVETLARRGGEFSTDDVWSRLDGQPPEPRVLGATMMSLARAGVIRRTGKWVPSARPECHARPVAVWEGAQ